MTSLEASLLAPAPVMIQRFIDVLFSYTEGFIPLRGFVEKGGFIKADWVLSDQEGLKVIQAFAQSMAEREAAFYVIPGTVHQRGQARASDILNMQAVMVDLDCGDIEAKTHHLRHYLGPPTLIVESGGITPEGQAKRHLYWQLQEPYGGEDLKTIAKLRELIALKGGGDPHFKSLHQPIRVAGSLYHKGGNKRLVAIQEDNPHEHDLADLLERAHDMPFFEEGSKAQQKNSPPLDLTAPSPLAQVFVKEVREGGVDGLTRFEALSRIIGYWLRRCHEGRCSWDQAWQEIQDYNAARITPPWPHERLRQETSALWAKHLKENGPPPEQVQDHTSLKIKAWSATVYATPAPLQRYLVYATFPMKAVSLLAAMGDTGKGLLTLQLALQVATGLAPDERGVNPPPYAFGQPIHEFGSAVIFTAEDDQEEVHRRLERLDPEKRRLKAPERLMVIPLPSAGGPIPLIQQGDKGPQMSSHYRQIEEQLLRLPDLKLIVFDPLSSFIHADTNADTAVGSFATGLFAGLAYKTGASVIVCHHMRKPNNGKSITTVEQARDAIRGSSALVDGVRSAYALWPADEEHQEKVFKTLNRPLQRNAIYWGALVKSNSLGDRTLRTYLRASTGLLEDVTSLLKQHEKPEEHLKDMLIQAIASAAARGHPFTHTGGSGLYRQRHRLPSPLRTCSRHRLEGLVQELLNERPLRLVKGMAPGSTENKWLDVPEGIFASGRGEFTRGADRGEI